MSHIHVHQSKLLITGSACKSILPPCSQTPGHIAYCPPISLLVLGARTNQSARSGCKDQSVCPFWVQGYQTPGQLSYTSTASRTESCHAEPEYALLVISQCQGNGCYGYQPKLCTPLFVSYTALCAYAQL